jgi:hypothetical protein
MRLDVIAVRRNKLALPYEMHSYQTRMPRFMCRRDLCLMLKTHLNIMLHRYCGRMVMASGQRPTDESGVIEM